MLARQLPSALCTDPAEVVLLASVVSSVAHPTPAGLHTNTLLRSGNHFHTLQLTTVRADSSPRRRWPGGNPLHALFTHPGLPKHKPATTQRAALASAQQTTQRVVHSTRSKLIDTSRSLDNNHRQHRRYQNKDNDNHTTTTSKVPEPPFRPVQGTAHALPTVTARQTQTSAGMDGPPDHKHDHASTPFSHQTAYVHQRLPNGQESRQCVVKLAHTYQGIQTSSRCTLAGWGQRNKPLSLLVCIKNP